MKLLVILMMTATPALSAAAPLAYKKDAPLADQPFWKAKPALMKKMSDDRYIMVSAKHEDLSGGKAAFTITGAGDVNRDKDACFKMAQDYPKLKDISDHFKQITFDEKEQKLFINVEALGYEARMLMKITRVEEDWRSEMQFEVIDGTFTGMKGVVGFERLGPRQTEVSYYGRYEAKELPIPKFLMGFAMEVVTQKVAEKMRSYLEAHIP